MSDDRVEPSEAQVVSMLTRAQALAKKAMEAGHHPFGALLVAADHTTVLMEQGNVDTVNHAEAVLARDAARRYSPAELWPCTLVTTAEPCAMCAGTQYWANIGRTVFGIDEKALLAETGNHPREPDARPAVPPRVRARPEGHPRDRPGGVDGRADHGAAPALLALALSASASTPRTARRGPPRRAR